MHDFTSNLIEYISAYDIFNNLLPGTLYCAAVDKYLNYSLLGTSVWVDICLCYVVGICISRVGSWLESKLSKQYPTYHIDISLERAPYLDYLKAENLDSKITLLNTVNNTYRSLMALMLCYYITVFYHYTLGTIINNPVMLQLLISTGLFLLFYFSICKQTEYIKRRIHNVLNKSLKEKKSKHL